MRYLLSLAILLGGMVMLTPAHAQPSRQGTLLLANGSAASFALVEFYAADGSVVLATANRKGIFNYDELMPGEYLMVISSRDKSAGYMALLHIDASTATLEVFYNASDHAPAETSSEPLVITLDEASRLSGQVAACTGACTVTLICHNIVLDVVKTDTSGRYAFEDIAPGHYNVTAYGNNWSAGVEDVLLPADESLELTLRR